MGKNRFIAYCGLDCETCQARLATIRGDEELKKKVAQEWSDLNNVEITPDMIHCTGCRLDGEKTLYCGSLCTIRQCARAKQVETCAGCADWKNCEKLGGILLNNETAERNLMEEEP